MSIAPAQAKEVEPAQVKRGNGSLREPMFSAPGTRALVFSLLLAALILVVYKQAAHFPFVNFDDDRYVTANAHVQAGLTWQTVKWALTSTAVANWHPLTWMSHAFDCQLFGLNAGGHHLTSILLHALNAVLLFFLLWGGTRRMGLSFFVAAVFALHPINVESVVWISERKNVLSTFFFLLTLGAYGWYAQKPGWKRYLAVAGLFTCGLASKPMVITLPFVLLLLDYWPLRRIGGPGTDASTSTASAAKQSSVGMLLLEKLPLFALSAASALVTIRAQQAAGAVGGWTFPLSVRARNAVYSYLLYAWKAIWPAKLAPLYPHPGYSLPAWKTAIALLFLITITVIVVKFRSRRYLAVGWFWFLGTLVPVIGIVQAGNQAMADRYAYVPLIGIFVMIVCGIAEATERIIPHLAWKIASAVFVLAALSLAAYRQIGYWRSNLDLWGHTLAVTKNNFVAEDEVGAALVDLGRTDEAYTHFVRAARIAPVDPVALTNIGFYLYQQGQPAEAVPYLKRALVQTSDSRVLATTYADLGSAYYALHQDDNSQDCFARSIRLDPNRFSTWLGMGLLAEREGKLQDAMRDFAISLKLQPNAQAYLGLGRTLAKTGRDAEALQAYELALKISPDLAEAQRGVAALRR